MSLPEMSCDLLGRMARHVEAESRYPAPHGGQAVELDGIGKPGEEPLPERPLVGLDRLPADRVDVVDGGHEAGQQLVLARAELEAAADRLVGGRPHLVRPPGTDQLLAAVGEPHVRAEELVRRADDDVCVPTTSMGP